MTSLRTVLPDSANVPDVQVTGMTEDSRNVGVGDVFVAVKGDTVDGHGFIPQAIANGASAVLAERFVVADVPVLVIPDLRRRRSELAGRLYGDPSRSLYCVGVTGTNGKTSIAWFIADLASRLGFDAGYLGTVGWGRLGKLAPASLTTADAITTQWRLGQLRDAGCRWTVLEASSHALAQNRLAAVAFDAAVFSNLSRDHLDYHADLESYGAAKARLFDDAALGVINLDDAFGYQLADRLQGLMQVIGYGSGARGNPQVRWQGLEFTDKGQSGRLVSPWGEGDFSIPLYGEFSTANFAAALTILCESGVSLEDCLKAARELRPVPGRMEFFRNPGKPVLVVDFAHTPDALENVLTALRSHVGGRLICLVGCGGDRDRGKRSMMGAVAGSLADEVWLTSDNPRSEEPMAIIDDMKAGLDKDASVVVEVDRERAIRSAVAGLKSGDVLLIAGKGHEETQEIKGRKYPLSDRALARTLTRTTTDESSVGWQIIDERH